MIVSNLAIAGRGVTVDRLELVHDPATAPGHSGLRPFREMTTGQVCGMT
jgi:hypothetical protein